MFDSIRCENDNFMQIKPNEYTNNNQGRKRVRLKLVILFKEHLKIFWSHVPDEVDELMYTILRPNHKLTGL